MKKWLSILLIILVVLIILIPIGGFYVLNNGNPYTKYLVNHYIPNYLDEKGYEEKDFKESSYVEPKHMINKDFYHGHYWVVFKDEPNTNYYFGLTKKGKLVKQFCEKDVLDEDGVTDIVSGKTKHSDSTCVNSLDNRE